MESDGFYQNAVYEDLRSVSREYIHRCHLRVNRHLAPKGRFLLDAGSGPIQWPEYLTYSEGYTFRVCADLSIEGLKEARKRIGDHGLFVVADVVHLPFKDEAFDGIVSLHTIHHVPIDKKKSAFFEIHRSLKSGKTAVVVNGWGYSMLMKRCGRLVNLMERILGTKSASIADLKNNHGKSIVVEEIQDKNGRHTGTYIEKETPVVFRRDLAASMQYQIFVWRTVSVRFLRAVIHPWMFGKLILRGLFWLEEKFPQYFGENGQYPMIVISK